MNEVKLLNIGGIDQNVKDQYARDIIAPSENGLDSTSNLPVASRHYDAGEFLIGQDRLYYEALVEINVGDTLVVNSNIKATTVSDELVSLRNKSADAAIECIAPIETTGLSTAEYAVGEYLYWDHGSNAGLYKVKVAINIGDAFVVDTNIEAAANVESQILALTNQVSTNTINITNASQKVSNSGDAYSSSKAYKVGDLVIYNNVLYRCITACSAAAWSVNQSCFTADTLTNVATLLNTRLTKVNTDLTVSSSELSHYNLTSAGCRIIRFGRVRTLIIGGLLDKDWQTSELLPICPFADADKPLNENWIMTVWNRYEKPLLIHFDDPYVLKLNLGNYPQATVPYNTPINIMITYIARG